MNTQKQLLGMAALLAASLVSVSADTLTQWTFDGDVSTPALGLGSASLQGGTAATFAAGNGGGRGWNTSTYKAQGTGSGEAGVQFLTGTTGFENIILSFDQRASGTASRWAQVDYTLDGGANWVTGFWNNNGGLVQDTFASFSVDFSSIAGADNNANFGVRVVSVFSPLAFDQNASLADFAANTAYMRANPAASYTLGGGTTTGDYGTGGTWRFDNVTVSGAAVPEPTALSVGALGLLGLIFRQRVVARR
jgi:hypothetical protein